jgi:hypothetical protein
VYGTYISRLYIDNGAAGNDYYYAAVGVLGGTIGVPETRLISQINQRKELWMYSGESGYVLIDPLEMEETITEIKSHNYQTIQVYDSDGYLRFLANGARPNRYRTDKVADRVWPYSSWLSHTPFDSLRMLIDYNDDIFVFYGVWEERSGQSDYFSYEPWPTGVYKFTRH